MKFVGKNPNSNSNKWLDFLSCYSRALKLLFIQPASPSRTGSLPVETTSESPQKKLSELMNEFGSDKANYGYLKIYEDAFGGARQDIALIVEIGIGTNNPDLPSNMGTDGKPGASLRAWREYAPHALIIGADIDKHILFQETRIETFFVDQLRMRTFTSMKSEITSPIDLVVIDGLHTPRADFNSLLQLLPLLAVGGNFFIEDVGNLALKYFWPILLLALKRKFLVARYSMSQGNLIHIRSK